MSTDEEIAQLHQQEAESRRRHAAAVAGLAAAEARVADAREDVQAEAGVTTVAEARAVLAGIEGQMTAETARVREQLALAGGAQ
jgi:hypothetical protein